MNSFCTSPTDPKDYPALALVFSLQVLAMFAFFGACAGIAWVIS